MQTPRAFARKVSAGLGEYLSRALSHRAALAEPKDLAWLLASYAHDGMARVEAVTCRPKAGRVEMLEAGPRRGRILSVTLKRLGRLWVLIIAAQRRAFIREEYSQSGFLLDLHLRISEPLLGYAISGYILHY